MRKSVKYIYPQVCKATTENLKMSSISFVQTQIYKSQFDFARSIRDHVIEVLSQEYNFDPEVAAGLFPDLNLDDIKTQPAKAAPKKRAAKVASDDTEKAPKPVKVKSAKPEKIPPCLPFMPELVNENLCCGLTSNNGMYTQCKNKKSEEGSGDYCKRCQKSADSNDGVPSLGNVEMRLQNLFDYKTPKKGVKMTPYSKVIAELGMTREEVREIASNFGDGYEIADEYFDNDVSTDFKVSKKSVTASSESKHSTPTSTPTISATETSWSASDASEVNVAETSPQARAPAAAAAAAVPAKKSVVAGKKSKKVIKTHTFKLEDGTEVLTYLNEETNEYYKNPEFNGEPFGLLQENGESCQYEDEDA